ncbi:hypothetical protein TNCV_3240921 [Trichonephila clavipes]|nr:hypothetical protein TNCV_3240921 [Trichonephila clavipes]
MRSANPEAVDVYLLTRAVDSVGSASERKVEIWSVITSRRERPRLCVLHPQMNSLAASVKLTYSASMVDRLTHFCLKVRHEIGVSSIKVMNPPIDTRSSLFVAKSESE